MTGERPAPLELRVSVDGAQRLLDAWKDGRLEQALGFPIEAIRIHTPFTPTPPGGAAGPAPVAAPDEGPSSPPAGPSARGGSGGRVAIAIAVVLLLALWFGRTLVTTPEEQLGAARGGVPGSAPPRAPGDSSARTSVEPEPAEPIVDAPGTTTGSGVESEPVEAVVPPDVGSEPVEAVMPPDVGGEPVEAVMPPDVGGEPVEALMPPDLGSEPVEAREAPPDPEPPMAARKGPAERPKAKTKRKRRRDPRLYSRYRCESAGEGFAIVVHAKHEAAAKVGACGSSEGDPGHEECVARTRCTLVEDDG